MGRTRQLWLLVAGLSAAQAGCGRREGGSGGSPPPATSCSASGPVTYTTVAVPSCPSGQGTVALTPQRCVDPSGGGYDTTSRSLINCVGSPLPYGGAGYPYPDPYDYPEYDPPASTTPSQPAPPPPDDGEPDGSSSGTWLH